MKISIVIPLYNKARHITRTINSILSQTHQEFEIVVVDDGSTDGSSDVVCKIQDMRIRLIVQPNAGECAARNRGIQESAYDLVAFLDADDEWLPSFLETVVNLRTRFPEAGMYATAYRFCTDGIMSNPVFTNCNVPAEGGLLDDYFAAGLGLPPVTSSSVMIPKTILNEIGGFPVGVKRGGDLHTWARIALRYRVAWSPSAGAVYHLSADNRACYIFNLINSDVAAAEPIESFLKSDGRPISSISIIEEYLASSRLGLVKRFLLSGNKIYAKDLLRKTQKTKLFRRKRLFLWCVFYIPHKVLRIFFRFKALCSNFKT